MKRSLALAGVTTLCAFACLAQPSSNLGDADRDVLDRVPSNQASVDKAAELGKAQNLAAFEHLIAANRLDLMFMYASGFGAAPRPAPEANAYMQRRTAELWDRPWVGVLLVASRKIDDPKLADLVMRDVTELARLRADRRKSCTIAVVSLDKRPDKNQAGTYAAVPINPRPAAGREILHETASLSSPIYWKASWRFVCSKPDAGDPLTDLDGRPPIAPITGMGMPFYPQRRDLQSLVAAPRITSADLAQRLAPLLVDLSLLPPVSWQNVGGKPTEPIAFPPIRTPREIVYFLTQQKVTPGAAAIGQVLAPYEGQASIRWKSMDDSTVIQHLLSLATLGEEPQGYAIVAHWIPIIAASTEQGGRDYALSVLIPVIGNAPPASQVDFDNVRREVLGALPYDQVSSVSQRFDAAELAYRAARDPNTDSLAYWAGSRHGLAHLDELLARKADPNASLKGNEPPLLIAARTDVRNVKRLLDAGANPDIRREQDGRTAMHSIATGNDNPDRAAIISLLVSRGADINATSKVDKMTPLHDAAQRCAECVRLLIAAGADRNAKDWHGETPLDMAVRWHQDEIARLLRGR